MAITIDIGTALANATANDASEVNTRLTTLKASIEDALSFLTEITDGWQIQTTSVAAGAVKTMLNLEWDPSDGSNLTDDVSGIGIDFTMPEDDDTQSIFAQISARVKNDAAGAWGGSVMISVADDVDGSLDAVLEVYKDVLSFEAAATIDTSGNNNLTLSAGTADVLVTASNLAPASDDGVALGVADTNDWSDLFLATGGVINWENGDVTLTHATSLLTMAGGDLQITTTSSDSKIFALHDSDIAHGYTGAAPTDQFFSVRRGGAFGGPVVQGIAEDSASRITSLGFEAYGGQANTTKTNAGAIGLVDFLIREHDGANNAANITADGNIFSLRALVGGSDVARMVVDEDGECHLTNTTLVALSDDKDDTQVCRAFSLMRHKEGAPGLVKSKYDDSIVYDEHTLVDMGILGDTVENGGLWNIGRHVILLNDALGQVGTFLKDHTEILEKQARRIVELERTVKRLEAA